MLTEEGLQEWPLTVDSTSDRNENDPREAYFADVSDGCGGTETWKYTSERHRRESTAGA